MKALHRVVNTRRGAAGTMHHTDRGSQYTSEDCAGALTGFGMVQSMSTKGNCWDNAVASVIDSPMGPN